LSRHNGTVPQWFVNSGTMPQWFVNSGTMPYNQCVTATQIICGTVP
jgi:hypothetical protein